MLKPWFKLGVDPSHGLGIETDPSRMSYVCPPLECMDIWKGYEPGELGTTMVLHAMELSGGEGQVGSIDVTSKFGLPKVTVGIQHPLDDSQFEKTELSII